MMIFLLSIFHGMISRGQTDTYTIKRYTIEHGLPCDFVISISKDQLGFLWAATKDGLARFDGYEFKNFYHNVTDSTSLASFDLITVLVDKNDYVWVHGPMSLSRFIRSSETFRQYFFSPNDSLSSRKILCAALDRDSVLWIVGDTGFEKYDLATDQFVHYNLLYQSAKLTEKPFSYLVFDSHNAIWLLNETDMTIYYGHINETESERSISIEKTFLFPCITRFIYPCYQPALKTDLDGNIWMATSNGLYRFDTATFSLHRVTNEEMRGEPEFSTPIVWSEVDKGIFIYTSDTVLSILCSTMKVGTGIFVDQDIVWFSGIDGNTMGIGMMQVALTHGKFDHLLFPHPADKSCMAITGLTMDPNGILWAGVRNEPFLLRISPDNRWIRCNYSDPVYLQKGNHPRTLTLINNRIWVGYLFNYCYLFDYTKPVVELNYVRNEQIFSNRILPPQQSYRLIHEDNQGKVYIGGDNTLFSFHPDDDQLDFFHLGNGGLYSFLQDHDSTIWIGTLDSIYRFDIQTNEREKIPLTTYKYNIESIVEGDTETLWMAIMGGGIGRFEKKTHKLTLFGKREGLINNYTFDILKDQRGLLWVSHNKGISVFNPQTCRFRNFGTDDGLMIEEFNADAACMTADGKMVFGGMGGIVSFYPDSVLTSTYKYEDVPLMITGFTAIADSIHVIHDIYRQESVTLPKGTRHVSLTFACIDFRHARKIQYRYRIEGVTRDWVFCDNRQRSVRLAGLLPGTYVFELQATDVNGEWTRNKVLAIDIPPFLYQTSGFRIGVVLFGVCIIYILLAMWRKQTRLTLQRKMVQYRLDSLRNQLNPHFLFNSLNSINYFISTHDQISANQFISGFSRLMRAILNNSEAEYIPLEKELEALQDYCKLEHLRFGDKFDYSLLVDEQIQIDEIEVTPTMIQPFVENAIWHGVRYLEGKKGLVTIEFRPGSVTHICCLITDNGIGRKASSKRKTDEQRKKRSKGMAIIRERLEMINAIRKLACTITVKDLYPERVETGTCVTIDIPIKLISYDKDVNH